MATLKQQEAFPYRQRSIAANLVLHQAPAFEPGTQKPHLVICLNCVNSPIYIVPVADSQQNLVVYHEGLFSYHNIW